MNNSPFFSQEEDIRSFLNYLVGLCQSQDPIYSDEKINKALLGSQYAVIRLLSFIDDSSLTENLGKLSHIFVTENLPTIRKNINHIYRLTGKEAPDTFNIQQLTAGRAILSNRMIKEIDKIQIGFDGYLDNVFNEMVVADLGAISAKLYSISSKYMEGCDGERAIAAKAGELYKMVRESLFTNTLHNIGEKPLHDIGKRHADFKKRFGSISMDFAQVITENSKSEENAGQEALEVVELYKDLNLAIDTFTQSRGSSGKGR